MKIKEESHRFAYNGGNLSSEICVYFWIGGGMMMNGSECYMIMMMMMIITTEERDHMALVSTLCVSRPKEYHGYNRLGVVAVSRNA